MVLQWIVNPIVLGSIIIFLAFWLLILQARHRRYSQEASKLKLEFEKYRQEMQTKVSSLHGSRVLLGLARASGCTAKLHLVFEAPEECMCCSRCLHLSASYS